MPVWSGERGQRWGAGAVLLAIGGCYGGADETGLAVGGSSTGVAIEGTDGPQDAQDSDGSESTGSVSGADATSAADSTGVGAADSGGSGEGESDGSEDGGTESESTGAPLEGCEAHADAWLCEDFEADLDPERWKIEEVNGGQVSAQDGLLHVALGSNNGGHGVIELQPGLVFPVPDNHLFGRVRMRIDAAVPDRHTTIFGAWGQLDGAVARYRLDSNNASLNSRYTHPTVEQHGGWRKHGPDAQADVWTCIEWEYDGQTNSMRYWFDGELNTDMEVDGAVEDPPWVAPIFDRFELGFHTYQAPTTAPSFDIWFDDLVLAADRVGC